MYLLGISFRASHESLFNFVQPFNILFKFLLCDAMFFVESCVKLTYRLMFFFAILCTKWCQCGVVKQCNSMLCCSMLFKFHFVINSVLFF